MNYLHLQHDQQELFYFENPMEYLLNIVGLEVFIKTPSKAMEAFK